MSSKSQSVPTEPIQLGSEGDLESVVSSYDVVLVDFYADWCGPCRMMEPTIEALAAETDAAVLKVDVDQFQGLAGQYGIQGIPALLLFTDGDLAERFVGVQQQEDLERAIAEHSG
jgi:thioredoxin 1